MSDRIEIAVGCTPRAQPRIKARVVQPKGRRAFAHFYTPSTADGFKDEVLLRARAHDNFPAEPWEGPIQVDSEFFFERPQYMLARKFPDGPILHTAKPDRDNLDKAVLDALTEAGLWRDDAQVCAGEVRKFYAGRGCQPGVIIVVRRLTTTEDPCSS